MKTKTLQSLAVTIALLQSGIASAGREKGGNGGDAYKIRNAYYSLDLVEAGIEENPSFILPNATNPVTADAVSQKLLQDKISGIDKYYYIYDQHYVSDLFGYKMAEIKAASPLYYTIVQSVLNHYTWVITSAELADIHDATSNINLQSQNMAQAAARYGSKILLNKSILEKMPQKNIVALIFHEINYAVQNLTEETYTQYALLSYSSQSDACRFDSGTNTSPVLNNSDLSRELTAKLFDPDPSAIKYLWATLAAENLKNYINIDLDSNQCEICLSIHKKDFYRIENMKLYEILPSAIQCAGADRTIEYPVHQKGTYNLSVKIKDLDSFKSN